MPRRLSKSVSLILAALFALTGMLAAQDHEGKNISSVEIRYRGAKTINETVLRNQMTSKAGTPYSADNLDKDTAALYEGGFVDDVLMYAEVVGDGVKLIVEVTTRPLRDGVGFEGNTVFSDEKLLKETKLGPTGVMSDAAILEARRNLEKYYRGFGYPEVSIVHRIEPTDREGHANLIFKISEGSKNEVRNIRFEGIQAFSSRDLTKEMQIKEKGLFSWLTKSGRFDEDQLDQDLDAVLDFYRSKGYLRVSSPGIRLETVADGRVDLIIPIDEGDKYTVGAVAFGKMTVFEPEELYPGLSLVPGEAYSSKEMRDDITMIRRYYGSKGYADASVNPDIEDAGPNQVKITYRVTEGEKFQVGRVNIAGNTVTKDKVIRREIPLQPGDMFNTVELETTKAVLQNMQYFNRVDAIGSPAGSGYRDIDVLVEEKKTGTISVGAGFSSIDSVVGFLMLEQINFDLFNPGNPIRGGFTGGGQRFSMNLRLGSERTDASVSLTEPWFLDRKLALGTELFYRDSTYFSDYYEQTNAGFAVSLRKELTTRSYLKGELRVENIDIDSDVTSASFGGFGDNSFLSQAAIGGSYARTSLGAHYVFDSRDSVTFARTGQKIDLGLTYAGLGGDVDTLTFTALGQSFWNFKGDTIFSLSGEMAFVEGLDGSDNIPIFDRMFLGGGRTLRGFEFRDIGPRDSGFTEEVYGGKSLGYVSAEMTVPIIDTLRGAAFCDAGYINTGAWDPSPSDVYVDVGIGIRLMLPISPLPLALDYALPVNSPDKVADKGGQFQFSLQSQF